jgi:hypothetical protein
MRFAPTALASLAIALNAFASFEASSVAPTEVVTLPEATMGATPLVQRYYNGGEGPGIWVVADGGYQLYVNDILLAQDNQAGRVGFVPYTFLPGDNVVKVVGYDSDGNPGLRVQIDELEKSHYSTAGSDWKAGTGSSQERKGMEISGWPADSKSQWLWTGDPSTPSVELAYKLTIKAEGFGATTTGGAGGEVVIADTKDKIVSALKSTGKKIILVPEGTYDMRVPRDAVAEATSKGNTWCYIQACKDEQSGNPNKDNTWYRISFSEVGSCNNTGEKDSPVPANAGLERWDNWIQTKQDKSLIGLGRGANLRGASIATRHNDNGNGYNGNQIYRNLAIFDVNPHLVEANDGLSVTGEAKGAFGTAKSVALYWIDHVSYKWISDGLDLEYLSNGTISWLDYDGENHLNCYKYDPYMHLVSSSDVTFANTYWHNSGWRVPKVDGTSSIHIYNSYVNLNTSSLIAASGGNTQVLYENNSLNDIRRSFVDQANGAKISWKDNTVTNSEAVSAPEQTVFTPSYSYAKIDRATIPTAIPARAGKGGPWGSMPSYDQPAGLSTVAPHVSLEATGGVNSISFAPTVNAEGTATLATLDFYIGNTLVHSSETSDSQTATGVPAGTYSVVVKATGKTSAGNNASSRSNFVTVTVTEEAEEPEKTPLLANPAKSLNPENPDSDIFDLQGNRVRASLVGAPPGVYIVRTGSQTQPIVVR